MDVQAIQDTLKTWVKAVTNLPVRWENQPNALELKLPAAIILTGPQNIESIGVDYVQWVPSGQDLQPRVTGHREFDVMLRVVSRSQAGNSVAQFWLEKIRAALKRPSAHDTFSTAGLAVLSMSAGVSFDAPFEERFESVASATLRLTAVIADVDDPIVVSIETVRVSDDISAIAADFEVDV